jgi:hypothetical protein
VEERQKAHRFVSRRWTWILGTVLILVIVLSVSLIQFTGSAHSKSPSGAESTPCPSASPAEGTAIAAASPAGTATTSLCVFADHESGLGTPVAVAGLNVNLHTDEVLAGPIDLTIDVTDSSGAPVKGAKVVVSTRSVEMDMGEYPHRADEISPGRYVADQVGMGMGGDWRVRVDISVSGQPTAVAFFLVTLKGLK